MMLRVKALLKNESGSYSVIFALSLAVLLAFCGATMDMGAAYVEASKLQTALDAGAIAGAWELPNTFDAKSVALDFVEENGFRKPDIKVEFGADKKTITLTSTQSSKTTFLRIVGIDKVDIGCLSSAGIEESVGGVFAYQLFSGDPNYTLNMGGHYSIDGSVHSNGSISSSPGKGVITGAAEACKTVYMNPQTTQTGQIMPGAPFIAMPDFTESVKKAMPTEYVIHPASDLNSPWWRQTWEDDIRVNGNVSLSNGADFYGDVYINGNFTANGGAPVCKIYGNIFVNGTLNFNNSVEVYGCIFATGDINFRGGGIMVKPTSPVCIYSEKGNINMATAGSEITGIVYAPKGNVSIAGGTTKFNGSIIGNRVKGIPANLVMGKSTTVFPFLPTEKQVSLIR